MSLFTIIDGIRDSLIPKQTDNTVITGTALRSILSEEFGADRDVIILDKTYTLVNMDWFLNFVKNYSTVNTRKYTAESFDCDSFSFVLKGEVERLEHGLAVGLLTVKTDTCYHMLNFFIDDDLDVYLLEPQSDKIFKLSETTYKPIRYEI